MIWRSYTETFLMHEPHLISVIMPAYNAENFINTAIKSIVGQTYQNFELIVIDDGSTDRTTQIVEDWQTTDDRIRLYSRENKGLIYTLNEAVGLSRGNFICRMDADDISNPNRLKRQLAHLLSTNHDLCGTFAEVFGDTYRNLPQLQKSQDIYEYLFFGNPIIHPSIMATKQFFKRNPYHPDYEHVEDYELWVRAMQIGAKISNVPNILLRYRTHQKQITSKHRLDIELKRTSVAKLHWNNNGCSFSANNFYQLDDLQQFKELFQSEKLKIKNMKIFKMALFKIALKNTKLGIYIWMIYCKSFGYLNLRSCILCFFCVIREPKAVKFCIYIIEKFRAVVRRAG